MMRVGSLAERIAGFDNLRLAFRRAALGRRQVSEVRDFSDQLDEELNRIRHGVLTGSVNLGTSRRFRIRDPKPRIIHAPPFRDRVLHHALMNICEPVFERGLVHDTYACRVGLGRLAAIRRSENFMGRHGWFLKLDIRSYFDSIDHDILKNRLCRKFKEQRLLQVLFQVIDAHERAPGKGLPIGALTSQHFANDYLSPLDRHIKEVIRVPGYVRYMDDMVLWADERESLRVALERLIEFTSAKLGLKFKEWPYLNRTRHGVSLLGYRLWPGKTALRPEAVRRIRRKVRGCFGAWDRGELSCRSLQEKLGAWAAFADGTGHPDERGRLFRREFWARAEGDEPSVPRRQLGELCEERAVRVPQRQPPVEPERESGLSSLPSSGSSEDDPSLTRRASGPSLRQEAVAKSVVPTGAGSKSGASTNAPVGAFPLVLRL